MRRNTFSQCSRSSFLVALVDFLADKAFESTAIAQELFGEDYQSPVLEAAENIRERIMRLAGEQGWRVRDDMHRPRPGTAYPLLGRGDVNIYSLFVQS